MKINNFLKVIIVGVSGLAAAVGLFFIMSANSNPYPENDSITVKIFLSDSRFAAEPYFDCSKTIALERQIPKTQAVARASLEALLRGATAEEKNQGYVSNINPGVKILGLTIKDGIAMVDFDEQIEFQVGGSCRVAAIRAQIADTLKQFPAINNVVISVNGRIEDVLQP